MIEIYIEPGNNDKLITYDILIDDKVMAEINSGEKKQLKLRSNNYKVQIVTKKEKSNSVFFTMKNEIISFVCFQNYRNNIFSRFLHKVILKNSLKLKIK